MIVDLMFATAFTTAMYHLFKNLRSYMTCTKMRAVTGPPRPPEGSKGRSIKTEPSTFPE